MSTEQITAPATGATWFNLYRHADDAADDATGAADESATDAGAEDDAEAERMLADAADDGGSEDAGEGDDSGDDADAEGLGDAGKKALDRMKAERAAAKKEAAAAKKSAAEERRKAADLARKVAEFEDRDKSELEKAQAKAERSSEQATKAVARSVRSEIKVVATGKFADVSDATDVLMRDPSKFVDADGEIDTDAIEAELADLLERKPHWAMPEPATAQSAPEAKRQKPKADPGQGSRGAAAAVDFRTASDDEVAAELAKFGVRKRY